MVDDVLVFRIISIIGGVLGLAIAVGLLLVPRVVSKIEKTLDKSFSTDKLEQILNKRKNLSEILLQHPRVFGFMLLAISFLLLLSNLLLF